MIKMKDSKGNKSVTLGFVYVAFLVGTVAFGYATFKSGTADLIGYGGFITATLMPWLGREWISKDRSQDVQ